MGKAPAHHFIDIVDLALALLPEQSKILIVHLLRDHAEVPVPEAGKIRVTHLVQFLSVCKDPAGSVREDPSAEQSGQNKTPGKVPGAGSFLLIVLFFAALLALRGRKFLKR